MDYQRESLILHFTAKGEWTEENYLVCSLHKKMQSIFL